MIKLTRPLAFIDLEATGLDIAYERIVEIGIVCLHPDGHTHKVFWRVNPGIPIPPEATAIHGITNEDVADCPAFDDLAPILAFYLDGCDLAGFNLLNYDVPLLWEEFYRAGIEWDLTGVRIIDAGNIFKKREPRSLSAAVKFYLGREHEGAHTAVADAKASADVLDGQLARYADLGATVEELAIASRMDDCERIDLAGKLVRGADGIARYAFGKSRGVAVVADPGLAEWMLRKDFSVNTKRAIRKVLDELDEDVYAPQPAREQYSMARAFASAGVGEDPFSGE